MFLAGYMIVHLLPEHVSITDALHIGGKMGRLNVITSGKSVKGFNWNDRYNIWSGLIGGFFLALSYFGTDQSQVGRYITAKNNRESRLGLLLNGLIKIPMQFCILLIGVLIFAYYQYNTAPLTFNDALLKEVSQSPYRDSILNLQSGYDSISRARQGAVSRYTAILHNGGDTTGTAAQLNGLDAQAGEYHSAFKRIASKASSKDSNDTNYIFLSFVKNHLPEGLKGLLIAIIFLAAWGSIAAALNSLAASTVIDFHKRIRDPERNEKDYTLSKWYTLAWGVFAILIAQFSSQLGRSLIEAVNILGSLFYGVVLGVFLVAFYIKQVKGTATFIAAITVEIFIVLLFFNDQLPFLSWLPDISFLWLNAVGALGVVILSWLIQLFMSRRDPVLNIPEIDKGIVQEMNKE
jgi:Na+/proline symporter